MHSAGRAGDSPWLQSRCVYLHIDIDVDIVDVDIDINIVDVDIDIDIVDVDIDIDINIDIGTLKMSPPELANKLLGPVWITTPTPKCSVMLDII